MANDPLFNIEMPRWWDRVAFLWRGLCLGFFLGYLFGAWAPPSTNSTTSMVVVAVALVLAALPTLPKAWIEQRNRIRAARSGTLMQEVERRRDAR
jgi:hypothetical protein